MCFKVTVGLFPSITWQVAVLITLQGGTSLCGGSIVGNGSYIVTAGHCLKSLSSGAVQVRDCVLGLKNFFFPNKINIRIRTILWLLPAPIVQRPVLLFVALSFVSGFTQPTIRELVPATELIWVDIFFEFFVCSFDLI